MPGSPPSRRRRPDCRGPRSYGRRCTTPRCRRPAARLSAGCSRRRHSAPAPGRRRWPRPNRRSVRRGTTGRTPPRRPVRSLPPRRPPRPGSCISPAAPKPPPRSRRRGGGSADRGASCRDSMSDGSPDTSAPCCPNPIAEFWCSRGRGCVDHDSADTSICR